MPEEKCRWTLETDPDFEPDDADRDEIAEKIRQGYNSGEFCHSWED